CLRIPFLAREPDFCRVDDDDEIAGVDVRCVFRPMLASQDAGYLHREPTHDLIGRINNEPAASQLALFGHVGGHCDCFTNSQDGPPASRPEKNYYDMDGQEAVKAGNAVAACGVALGSDCEREAASGEY